MVDVLFEIVARFLHSGFQLITLVLNLSRKHYHVKSFMVKILCFEFIACIAPLHLSSLPPLAFSSLVFRLLFASLTVYNIHSL